MMKDENITKFELQIKLQNIQKQLADLQINYLQIEKELSLIIICVAATIDVLLNEY